jgi:CubicO group peptidase (beta-lactamase class C family)
MTGASQVLQRLAAEHGVPGAQLAVYASGDVSTTACGELVHRGGRPVTAETCFPIGSVSKLFTATLAMVLVADGDLELDAPARSYLDPVEQRDVDPALTLRHLLSHTGGLPAGPAPSDVDGLSIRRYVQEYCRGGVVDPGAYFSYSNVGYVLVGRIVETVTGMGWEQAISSVLLAPLGIGARLLPESAASVTGPPLASGHAVNRASGRTRPVRQGLVAAEAPAGALAVSAGGLLSLGMLHLEPRPRLLPAADAAEMRTPVPGAAPYGLASGWGLGLAVYPDGVVGHDGNAYGTSCHLRVSASEGWAVALTTNANSGTALWPALLEELAGMGIGSGVRLAGAAAPATAPGPRASLEVPAGLAGRYVNGDTEYSVVDADGGLWLSVDGDPYARVMAHPDLTFELVDPDSGQLVPGGRFLRDDNGAVALVQLGGRLARREPATSSRQLIA